MARTNRRSSVSASRKPTAKPKAAAKKRPQGASRAKPSTPQQRPIPKGRLIVFAILAALLGYAIWLLSERPNEPVEGVPAALDALEETPQTETPAEPVKPAERFEFYDILPNQRVLPSRTPDARGVTPPPRSTTTDTRKLPASIRWLQVGAFRDAKQAQQRLNILKQLNLPARSQSGFDAQGKPLTRIVAGPFDSARHLAEARTRLANEGLDAIPLSSLGVSR